MYSSKPLIYISDDDFTEVGHPIMTLEALDKLTSVDFHLFSEINLVDQDQVFCKFRAKIEKLINNGEILKEPFLGKIISFADKSPHFVLKMPSMKLMHSFFEIMSSICERLKNGFSISVLFSEPPENLNKTERILLDIIYNLIVSNISLWQSTVIFCERNVLLNAYRKQYPEFKYDLCGFPTVFNSNGTVIDRVGFAFIGESRLDKGLQQIVDLASISDPSFDLYVHTNCNPRNSSCQHDFLIKKLEAISLVKSNIHTIKQDIDEPYDYIFCEGLTPLLLYDKKYKLKGSGILQEIHYRGIVAVAYSDLDFHMDFPDNIIPIDRTSNIDKLYSQVVSARNLAVNSRRTVEDGNILTPEKFYEVISNR